MGRSLEELRADPLAAAVLAALRARRGGSAGRGL
jgi:hypothetical protein